MKVVSPAPVILLVEDECIVRVALAGALEEAGWTIIEVATGEAALMELRDGQPINALVTDIHIDGYLSGWEVAEGVRALRLDMPVIYMSGKASEKSRMVPGSVFLGKPCLPADILAACHAAMQSSQSSA